MLEALIFTLIAFDGILLWFVFKTQRGRDSHTEILGSVSEERKIISEIHEEIRMEISSCRQELRAQSDKIQQIATEIDHEMMHSRQTLTDEGAKVASDIKELIEEPIADLAKKLIQAKKLCKRVEMEREMIAKILVKAEKICQFLDQKVPYEDLLNEIADKKYSDARALLAHGKNPRQVAQDLGMTESEVRLVAGLSL